MVHQCVYLYQYKSLVSFDIFTPFTTHNNSSSCTYLSGATAAVMMIVY